MCGHIHNLGLGKDVLDITPQGQEVNEKKLDFIETKNFLFQRTPSRKQKDHHQNCKKYANPI